MSLRDEMADAIKTIRVLRPSSEQMADALMPLVERAVREAAFQGIGKMEREYAISVELRQRIDDIVARVLK